ncbi:MAG TPA: chemotaxis protein CheW [Candidatus Acidoferrum sp.]|nr:chemotaxis protein CheW [Candidatus Acidoferrum sp.]
MRVVLLTPAKQRARAKADGPAVREQFLLFRVGDEIYGLGLRGLWEVLLPEGVTDLPTPPYQVCTALAYRGRRIALIRMGELFGVAADGLPASARVLLTQGQGRPLGLLVDEVLGVAEVDPARIAPVPPMSTLLSPRFFRGLFSRNGRVILLVDGDGLAGFEQVVGFYAAAP